MDQPDLIRTGEAAIILGSSRQHVVDLCDSGRLSCERSPTHRRIRRTAVEAYANRIASTPRLNRDQRQSLWLHAAVAGRLASQPTSTLAHARANLSRLRTVHPTGMSAQWLDTWHAIIEEGPEAVLQTLTSATPSAIELRQNSPFAGILRDDERRDALRAFRELDRALQT